VLYTTL
jgi:hypothetical protein